MSSPSVCRSRMKERKKERKKKATLQLKNFCPNGFFSVVLKIIHYLFKVTKKLCFERNINSILLSIRASAAQETRTTTRKRTRRRLETSF